MSLSTEEAEKFWPVYNDYEKEQKMIREKFQPNKNNQNLVQPLLCKSGGYFL
jgi:hypothetical protein